MKLSIYVFLGLALGLALNFISFEADARSCTTTRYLKVRPDVARGHYGRSGNGVQVHYIRGGQFEGMCNPNIQCTWDQYYSRRPDVARDRTFGRSGSRGAWHHWNEHGYKENMCEPYDPFLVGTGYQG